METSYVALHDAFGYTGNSKPHISKADSSGNSHLIPPNFLKISSILPFAKADLQTEVGET